MKRIKEYKILLIILPILLGIFFIPINAQELESDGYKILNSTVNSGGGVATSSGYSLFQDIGSSTADASFESENYTFNESSPSTFQASIPLINCFETTSTGGSTTCSNLTSTGGMVALCGEPGCYDRAKLEIDDQTNPIDTRYLVSLSTDNFVNEVFFLQADHTLATTFDINSYLTQCQLEGIDAEDPSCNDSGDANWNSSLQSYNVIGLTPNKTYDVAIRALHGDFTETQYSPTATATTSIPSIGFDIDVSTTDTESVAPYFVTFGDLSLSTPKTPDDSIWLDISTNNINGVDIRVESTSSGLYSVATNSYINSETEDLDIDDGDGGYGAKLISVTQQSLGPLQQGSAFNTSSSNAVGALRAIPTIVAFTDITSPNRGPITNGRAQLDLKAKSYSGLASGTYTDTLFFTAISR